MSFVLSDADLPALLSSQPITDAAFREICSEHPDLRFEMTADGELIVLAPTGFASGVRNTRITRQLDTWAEQDGNGFVSDSSTGFVLPNKARRSPDCAWTLKSKVRKAQASRKDGFLHLCPDFVIELRSETDRLKSLKTKMQEYIDNGAQLGWLIDPSERSITIYRPNAEPESRANINSISGEGALATFTLELPKIWNPLAD